VMKKKQIFFLEQQGNEVFIKSHLNRYLTFKEDGKFLADATVGGKDEALTIEAQADGKWALKTARGYYAGGTGEKLDAYTKVLAADRLWTVQLAMHPQVAIKNVNRKRYVHLSKGQLTVDEDIPWGSDSVITLIFFEEGKYGLEADNGTYLSETSELKAQPDESCKFTLEFFQQMVAFKSKSNKYLTAVGASGVLKATKDGPPGNDELFVLEDSLPQFKLKLNGQFASIKRGIEVTFNQPNCEDTEIFQFEIDQATKKYYIKTCQSKLWSCLKDGSIQAVALPAAKSASELFAATWLPPVDGAGPKLSLQASNGNYVTVKPNGQVVANTPSLNEFNQFTYELINRPKLVLRGEFGFVSTLPSGVLQANSAAAEVYNLHVSGGQCKISASNGKYWKVGVSGITATGDEADLFSFLFIELSKFVILAPNGKFVQGQQNGSFTATGTTFDATTLWEF